MQNRKWIMILLLIIVLLLGCTPSTELTGETDVLQNETNATETSAVEETSELIDPQTKQTEVQSTNAETNPEHIVTTKGELQVHFIDVGQGSSQLIIGPTGKTILIDAGNNNKANVVVDYLNNQNVTKLDYLVGSHPDGDHIGGLDVVIDSFEIGKIFMSRVQANTKTFEDVLLAIQRKGLKVTTAKAGLTLDWEVGTSLKMVAPVVERSDTNEMSAVIHLTFGEISFLLTGDAGTISEKEMIDSGVDLQSDVLMVGHHGSDTATSQAFLDVVQPSYAVIQVGADNSYGHPASGVLDRLIDKGIKVYRNDKQGNIVFITDGKDIEVSHDNIGLDVEDNDDSTTTNPVVTEPTVVPIPDDPVVVYKNCTAVRLAGKAPIHKGDPGYSSKLDRDGDGVGCE